MHKGWYTYDVYVEEEGGGVRKKLDVIGHRGRGERVTTNVPGVQSLFFFIKENLICTMTRRHAESNINI